MTRGSGDLWGIYLPDEKAKLPKLTLTLYPSHRCELHRGRAPVTSTARLLVVADSAEVTEADKSSQCTCRPPPSAGCLTPFNVNRVKYALCLTRGWRDCFCCDPTRRGLFSLHWHNSKRWLAIQWWDGGKSSWAENERASPNTCPSPSERDPVADGRHSGSPPIKLTLLHL